MSGNKPTVRLRPALAQLLADRLLAMHLEDGTSDWLRWEDLPYLDEESFALVMSEVKELAIELWEMVRRGEMAYGVDSADLLEECQ